MGCTSSVAQGEGIQGVCVVTNYADDAADTDQVDPPCNEGGAEPPAAKDPATPLSVRGLTLRGLPLDLSGSTLSFLVSPRAQSRSSLTLSMRRSDLSVKSDASV